MVVLSYFVCREIKLSSALGQNLVGPINPEKKRKLFP